MIRIVGVQRHEDISKEFILLQNQGSMRVNLKGHIVAVQSVLDGETPNDAIHFFNDDIDVLPGMYVLLRTCSGVSHWNHSQDAYSTYYGFMQRRTPIWFRQTGPMHIMAPQHTWVERKTEAALT